MARYLELHVASQGDSVHDAVANLREAVELYLNEVRHPTIESTPLVTSFQVETAA